MSTVEQLTPSDKWVGQAMRRKEDPRMITGRGRYVDDIALPGMLHMAVVRSTEAHAKIVSIDTSGAKARARRSRRVHRRGHRSRRADADGVGAAGRRGQGGRALAARQGR